MNYELTLPIGMKDGKESIEHQIDIHVSDLLLLQDFSSTSVSDILAGLRYVMEFRIKGGRMPHLKKDICKRLSEALLLITGQCKGNFLSKKLTAEADLAFTLFGNFMEEVEEFNLAVGEISATDLRYNLKLHMRLNSSANKEQQQAALAILSVLTQSLHFKEWKELVKEDEIDDVADFLKGIDWQSTKMPKGKQTIWPPLSLFFDRKPERVLEIFSSDPVSGLESSRIKDLVEHYGSNTLPPPPKRSFFKMLWRQISDFMILILIAATIVSAAIDHEKPTSPIVLAIVIVFNVVIGLSQEWKASKALEALMILSIPMAKVVRDGKMIEMEASGLVPGDLVILEEGDAVPADLRLIEVSQLEIVEAILTGESIATEKNIQPIKVKSRKLPLGDCAGNAFMATVVSKGRGKGIVVRTGESTEIGKISSAINSTPEIKTPIQRKLLRLGQLLVVLSVVLCILVTIIGIAWGKDAIDMVRVGVSLAVSVIPEGLVAVVTVTMALAVSRMAKQNAIVRNLPSVETLGSVTVICSDKTGTLTEGKMTVRKLHLCDEFKFEFSGSLSDPLNGKITLSTDSSLSISEIASFKLACMIVSMCNHSSVTKIDGKWKFIGDTTDLALLVASNHSGFNKEYWQSFLLQNIIYEIAFDSDRKLMTVVFDLKEKLLVLTKGAPENLVAKCSKHLSKQGESHNFGIGDISYSAIDDHFLTELTRENEALAIQGLRVLGLAYKIMDKIDAMERSNNEIESNLTFVGLVGIIDPPRATVKSSIADCQKAGIKVCMITGDHIQTATAISTALGIFDPTDPLKNRAIRGKDLDILSDEAIAELKPFPCVFARVSPENKLTIVRVLQSLGESVSMTGDGVNDAPAIKRANIGVAMGITGTEITKQAASIVLSDDNFSTIVAAIKEGRRVFDNISKFIIYLLSCNSAEIWVMLISVCANLPPPFSSVNILYANIIADIPPSMSMGLEPTEADIMERPPRRLSQGIITKLTGATIIFQGLILSALALAIYFWEYFTRSEAERVDDLIEMRSITFIALTTNQLVLSFLSRSIRQSVFQTGIWNNKYMVAAFIFSMGCLVGAAYIPGLNDALELAPFGWLPWMKILVSVLILIVASEAWKFGVRKKEARVRSRAINGFCT